MQAAKRMVSAVVAVPKGLFSILKFLLRRLLKRGFDVHHCWSHIAGQPNGQRYSSLLAQRGVRR
jgi:hypothetical protein